MPGNFSFLIPGKLAGCGKPGGWGDARSDLSGLARMGIGAVVTLTEERLNAAAVRDVGMRYLHLPIEDFHPPARDQIVRFVAFVDECLRDGIAVVVHCGAGMGRTGTMLASYLVHEGMEPEEAIRTVRRERPGSIETAAQEESIAKYHRYLRNKSRREKNERNSRG